MAKCTCATRTNAQGIVDRFLDQKCVVHGRPPEPDVARLLRIEIAAMALLSADLGLIRVREQLMAQLRKEIES